jgi:DNA-binding transcriptional regulator YiaG
MGDEVVAVVLGYMRDAGRPIPPPSPYSGSVTVESPPAFTADRIREIRRGFDVSQRVFADMLNVSLATVRAWEQGLRTPDGAATRLLFTAEHHPVISFSGGIRKTVLLRDSRSGARDVVQRRVTKFSMKRCAGLSDRGEVTPKRLRNIISPFLASRKRDQNLLTCPHCLVQAL